MGNASSPESPELRDQSHAQSTTTMVRSLQAARLIAEAERRALLLRSILSRGLDYPNIYSSNTFHFPPRVKTTSTEAARKQNEYRWKVFWLSLARAEQLGQLYAETD